MGEHWETSPEILLNCGSLDKLLETLGIHMALISSKGPLSNLCIIFLKKYRKSMMI